MLSSGVTALVGVNGAGKSTLLRALAGGHVRAEAVSLVLLAVGGGSILIDHLVQYYPISQVMARVEPWSAALVYLVGLGLYVLVPAVVPVRPRHRDF